MARYGREGRSGHLVFLGYNDNTAIASLEQLILAIETKLLRLRALLILARRNYLFDKPRGRITSPATLATSANISEEKKKYFRQLAYPDYLALATFLMLRIVHINDKRVISALCDLAPRINRPGNLVELCESKFYPVRRTILRSNSRKLWCEIARTNNARALENETKKKPACPLATGSLNFHNPLFPQRVRITR